MKIGMAQIDIIWENKEENRLKCESIIIQGVQQNVDFIIFPEMTLTGFSMNTKAIAEPAKDCKTLLFFKKMSRKYGITIGFGYVLRGDHKCLNNMAIVKEGKQLFEYTKIHPFSHGTEGEYYEGGTQIDTAMIGGIHFGGFICYDLRFPELFTAASKKSQAIIVIANWPQSRIKHWTTLLKARAIENQVYIIGVNRTGNDKDNIYDGMSVIVDPRGNIVAGDRKEEGLIVGEINADIVEEYRKEFPVAKDRREDLYHLL